MRGGGTKGRPHQMHYQCTTKNACINIFLSLTACRTKIIWYRTIDLNLEVTTRSPLRQRLGFQNDHNLPAELARSYSRMAPLFRPEDSRKYLEAKLVLALRYPPDLEEDRMRPVASNDAQNP